ncbi:MAG: glycosyltransferase family 2 protein [Deferrisomatales bacterium]
METEPVPGLTVIVPTFNGGEKLTACLGSIAASDLPHYELLVVDDGSTDDSVPHSLDRGRVIRHGANRGVSAARNTGAGAARAEVLVFVDSDVIVPADFLTRIARDFAAAPGLQCKQAICSALPANRGFSPELLTLMWRYGWLRGGASATCLNSFAFAIRKSPFQRAGGFDERLGTAVGGEEIELAQRLSRMVRLEVDPTLEVRHHFQHFWPRTRSLFSRARRHGRLLLSTRCIPTHGGGRPSEMVLAAVAAGSAVAIPFSLPAAGAAGVVYVLLRLRFLSFVARHRGARFALRSIPALWAWSLVGGAGVALGIADRGWELLRRDSRA